MASQRQIPGGPYVNETGSAQRQSPGGPYANETQATGAVTATPGKGSVTASGKLPTVSANERYARPIADLLVGAWVPSTGSDLYAMLDEGIANDGDYIYTAAASLARVRLNAVQDPGTSSGQVLSYRGKGVFTVRMKCGTTLIAEWTENRADLATVTRSLTAEQCDAITDYTDLRVELETA